MQKIFTDTIKRLDVKGKILLAVSGGIDSMCMAQLFLDTLDPQKLAVAHCNFHLRGAESDDDELLVGRWCYEKGLKFHIADFATADFAAMHGISIEMAARKLRYEWFSDLCRKLGFAAVAVAHNTNDNVETLLLNLARGTGINGLTGIDEYSVNKEFNDLVIIRPMLTFTREKISEYVASKGVPFREDGTNYDVKYKRNRIRHQIMPALKELNPSYLETISRSMEELKDVERITDEWFDNQHIDLSKPEFVSIPVCRIRASHYPKYLLYRLFSPYGFTKSQLRDIERLLKEKNIGGKEFRSPGAPVRLLTTSRSLIIDTFGYSKPKPKPRKETREMFTTFSPVFVTGKGSYFVGGRKLEVSVSPYRPGMQFGLPEGTLVLSADYLGFPFWIRPWYSGDWMRPYGMSGRKKLSNMFADLKFSLLDKEEAAMVVKNLDDTHVMALLGRRIDDSLKISYRTKKVIKLQF